MKTPTALTMMSHLTATLAFRSPLQNNHGMLCAQPPPGSVTMDGRLDEWDLSGKLFVYNARSLCDQYSVRVHACGTAMRSP